MPVIHPLTKEKAAPELQEIYAKLTGANGFMPNFFGVMAHAPGVLQAFLPLYGSIMNKGTLEPRYKELAYLKTALVNGCEYCMKAHTASSQKVGVTLEQIQALAFYQRSPLFDEKDKMTILYADRVTRGAAGIREGSVEELKKHFTEQQIVELTLVICVANFTNRFNDALQPVPDLGV